MANHTVIDLDDYRESEEGGATAGKELEPRGAAGTVPRIEIPHRPVDLTVSSDVAAYVESRPESIDPEKLRGTPATADDTSSHFRELKPVAHHEVTERHTFFNQIKLFFKGIFMPKSVAQDSGNWLEEFRWAHHYKGEVRKESEQEAA